MYDLTIDACNPEDEDECLTLLCKDDALCCVADENGDATDECADCSNADFDNFNPEDCEEA